MAQNEGLNKITMRSSDYHDCEKGAVMLVTLVLSAVAIIVTAALIVLVTAGTQISGKQARYKDAREAARGCADLFIELIETRGDGQDLMDFQAAIAASNNLIENFNIWVPLTCQAVVAGKAYAGVAAKLTAPQTLWSPDCNTNLIIDPGDQATYDMSTIIGARTRYMCYAKIVMNTEGNSGRKATYHTKGVVNTGDAISPLPYYYAIEILAEPVNMNIAHAERSRLSILFQY